MTGLSLNNLSFSFRYYNISAPYQWEEDGRISAEKLAHPTDNLEVKQTS
jgi:hypothetical protein